MLSLGEELPKEIVLVLKIQDHYREMPGNEGEVAVANIQQMVNEAGTAILMGNNAGMLRSYKQIKRVTVADGSGCE
jgi:hypothetical protein